MTIKAIALDFDNCIALNYETRMGSEEIKDEAWFKIFPEYDRGALEPVLEKVKKEIAGGKGDRKDIVKRVCEHFGISETKIQDEVIKRCDGFNRVVQEGIARLGISPQTAEDLATLSKKIPLFVNTATPREGALESLDALGVRHYFKEVYGRPGTKINNLKDIISSEAIAPYELLFVDDQESGYNAAREVYCSFVGIHTARNKAWHDVMKLPFPLIFYLRELLPLTRNFR